MVIELTAKLLLISFRDALISGAQSQPHSRVIRQCESD
jgi:hypothetical protein